ncbi:MAG: MFS transporter [Opitutaceae bacterium]|nr:MFS transporter [Cytophagales bacterium]
MRNDPKVIRAWCMYDWANSVYSLIITSSIFPAYYQAVTKNPLNGDRVHFLGFDIVNSVLYSYTLSFSFLCVVILSPIFAGIADHLGRKKLFMQFFCTLGSFACMGLYFFTGENIGWGLTMLILATIGYAGSLVFYNAFLPEITTAETSDKVSAKGFSFGYIGSVILLIINLLMILKPELFGGISSGTASRISFLMVGVWWLGFAQYTFWVLPEKRIVKSSEGHVLTSGFKELHKVFNQVKSMATLKRFLLAFFFCSMGVQTVMYVATLFGEKEFHLETGQLITVVLILQLIAIPGANFAAYISKKRGNIFTLICIVSIWVLTCIGAYFMQNGNQFYMLAVVVGLVMGAIQALSRSTYSKFLPKDSEDNASFFSFYDVTEKLAIVIGTFSYGLIENLTGSMRNSILALGLFFVAGFYFLYITRKSIKDETSVN